MTKPRVLLTVAAVGTAVMLLTGCVQGDPQPKPSSTRSFLTPGPTSPPTAVSAPTSSDSSWIEANKTVNLFTRIQYDIEHDGGANVDRIDVAAANDALTSMQQIASDLKSKGLKVTGGAPGWEPNVAASSFGTVVDSSGKQITNGIVYARGCWDLSKQTSVANTGTSPPDRSVKIFPIQFNVAYFPADRIWRVTNQTNITGQSGAPQC